MRVFKKVIMIIFAILPIFSFVLFAFTNFGNTTGQSFEKFGSFYVDTNSSDGHNLMVEDETIFSELVNTLIGDKYYAGKRQGERGKIYEFYRYEPGNIIDSLLNFVDGLEELGFSSPCLIVFLYVFYMFFVELIMMVYEIIIFIPRKCREIFGG